MSFPRLTYRSDYQSTIEVFHHPVSSARCSVFVGELLPYPPYEKDGFAFRDITSCERSVLAKVVLHIPFYGA